MVRLSLITLPYFLCGQMNVSTGAGGMGASLTPMIISVLGICAFRVFWIYTFFRAFHTRSACSSLPHFLDSHPGRPDDRLFP